MLTGCLILYGVAIYICSSMSGVVANRTHQVLQVTFLSVRFLGFMVAVLLSCPYNCSITLSLPPDLLFITLSSQTFDALPRMMY